MDRFESLASDYFDGSLGSQDAAELAAILREDPRRKRIFIDLVQQDRLLGVDLGSESDEELARKILAEIEGGDTGHFVNRVLKRLPPPDAGPARATRSRRLPPVSPTRSGWRVRTVAAAAAAAVLLGLIGYGFFFPSAPELPGVTATVESVVGKVAAPEGRAVRVGEELSPGQTITTIGPGSAVTWSYPDRTRIELGGDASLRFQTQAEAVSGISLLLHRGLLRAEVARQPSGRPFLVRSRFAETRVLGTKFALWADADSTRLEVEEGRVRFIRDGDSRRQGVEVGPGEKALAS
ncbi:MAG TPA: FecR family protein, partial [Planctomycetota bacterium]|nr:FecR family protein [Planctomycetota bacterium]